MSEPSNLDSAGQDKPENAASITSSSKHEMMMTMPVLDSGMTSPTDTWSVSDNEGGYSSSLMGVGDGGGFLNAIGADFRMLATSLREKAGGVVSFVHRSAMNVAAEISRLEEYEDYNHNQHHNRNIDHFESNNTKDHNNEQQLQRKESDWEQLHQDQRAVPSSVSFLPTLPWLIRAEDDAGLSIGEKGIFGKRTVGSQLKNGESDDQYEYENDDDEGDDDNVNNDFDNYLFADDAECRQVVQSLLDVDENLVNMHKRLSVREDFCENAFWMNYFYHCVQEQNLYVRELQSRELATKPGPLLTSLYQRNRAKPNVLLGYELGMRPVPLPWVITKGDGSYEEDDILKSRILAISQREDRVLESFLTKKKNDEQSENILDEPECIQAIDRLLELDNNLATAHARLSGRDDFCETVFWKNYFYHCMQQQSEHIHTFQSCEQSQDDSLVPAEDSASLHSDNESYVIASPPTSTGLQSVGSLIIVGHTSNAKASDNFPSNIFNV